MKPGALTPPTLRQHTPPHRCIRDMNTEPNSYGRVELGSERSRRERRRRGGRDTGAGWRGGGRRGRRRWRGTWNGARQAYISAAAQPPPLYIFRATKLTAKGRMIPFRTTALLKHVRPHQLRKLNCVWDAPPVFVMDGIEMHDNFSHLHRNKR